jgi:glycosyltransferase involved in cell wall biosynthesis
MRLRFLTSTPLEVTRGSGTFVGITTLANALRNLGAEIEFATPSIKLPIYTLQRLLFNQQLRFRRLSPVDVTVGFDMDGYTLSSASHADLHVASIKGVIADEMRFERGVTHATMRIQAARERLHVSTADAVVTTSRYSASRIRELYGLAVEPQIVPELIDLEAWTKLLHVQQNEKPRVSAPLGNVGRPPAATFTVLTVCRFYPRKRLDILLRAAGRLRTRIPSLEFRIVGGGPDAARLKRICQDEKLEGRVVWCENISQAELAQEYNNCDVFCLPSVQEGFGIVFLEAMAAGKPIVAARAAAAPEVVPHAVLVDPENDEALAAGLERLYHDHALRDSIAAAGVERVKQFDAPIVAKTFLSTLEFITETRLARPVSSNM